jgi:PAS domain S-box-containing protein
VATEVIDLYRGYKGKPPAKLTLGPSVAGTTPRILVIDDNPEILSAYSKILAGCTATQASRDALDTLEKELFGGQIPDEGAEQPSFDLSLVQRGEEGLACVRRAVADGRPYAVAFVDMRMPGGWDGLETIEALWRTDPTLQVVICTAYSDFSWQEITGRLGRRDSLLILRKPFDAIEVLQLACALADRWKLQHEGQVHIDVLKEALNERSSALRQQEAFHGKLLKNLSEGVVACDHEGRVSLVNQTLRRWLTLPEECPLDELRERFCQQGRGEALATVEHLLERALSGEKLRNIELRLGRAGELQRTVLASGGPLQSGDNSNFAAVITLHDMTEQQQSERRFAELFEYAPDAIFIIDDAGSVVQANGQAEAMFGLNRAALLVAEVGSLMPGIMSVLEDVVTSCHEDQYQPIRMDCSAAGNLYGSRLGGEIFPVDISLAPVWFGGDRLLMLNVRDVSQRLESERVMHEITTMLDTIEDAAFIVDPDDLRFLYVNDGAVRMLGRPRAELLKLTPQDVYEDFDPSYFRHSIEPVLRRKAGAIKLTTSYRSASARVVVDIKLQYMVTREGMERFIAVARDVSRRENALRQSREAWSKFGKANETIRREREQLASRVAQRTKELVAANQSLEQAKLEAERASQAKSSFLANMSHELRTPLNGVIGMVEVLARAGLHKQQQEMVDLIRASANSLVDIISDILDLSKVEAGHLELEKAPVSIAQVIEMTCAMLDNQAMEQGVELMLFTDPALPHQVLGDEVRLRQIMLNLVSNAVKFSAQQSPGRVSVRATLAESSGASAVVRLEVRDNGIGMDEKAQTEVFAAFRQADSSTTRCFGGTGLGLAITHHLVELMGGDIRVQSRPGQGSNFTVMIPLSLESAITPKVYEPAIPGHWHCFVVGGPRSLAPDITVYLRHSGIKASKMASIADIQQLLPNTTHRHPVLCIVDSEGQLSVAERRAFLQVLPPGPDIRYLVIERGGRRTARVLEHGCVSIDGNVLTRSSLLAALALAAGVPRPQVAVPGSAAVQAKAILIEAEHSQPRILVAEDNPVNQKVILYQLKQLGYNADIVADGTSALTQWKERDYDLLLTDIQMPGMDGYQLAEAIRAETGWRKPIVALTANVLVGEAQRCLDIGMNDWLSKPLSLGSLEAVLERWLGEDAALRQDFHRVASVTQSFTETAVDLEVLKGMVGDDAKVLHEMLQEFQHFSEESARSLLEYWNAGQLYETSAIAHRLKSSARAVGASRWADICEAIEREAGRGKSDDFQQAISAFSQELTRVSRHIKRLLEEYGSHFPKTMKL